MTEIESGAVTVGNQANAVLGIYGIPGTGKTNLADTAAEYAYETFGASTMCYVADLGGFGNKRLSLIRAGIMRVYDPRNHVNAFETMELISLGAFPVSLLDPERGYADPNVPLVLPRRTIYQIACPQGHVAGRYEQQVAMNAAAASGAIKCPTCGVVTNLANTAGVEQLAVKHRMFEKVGVRIYDSFTALNEWGLADLQEQSAKGTLPSTGGGGSLLGAADALVSGQFRFGSSSMGQYGFLQNRTYGWLANIKKIPDQVLPAIATFHVEQSKGDETTGGDMLYGPKIAGNARTGAIVGWLGSCLHATREPFSATDASLVYRLWLRNHIDPRDPRKIPYVAKHRGSPVGMPEYLEDQPGQAPWTGFSLAVFFTKLQEQLARMEAERQVKYPHAPGVWTGDVLGAEADIVVGAAKSMTVPRPAVGATATVSQPGRAAGGLRKAGAATSMSAEPVRHPAPTTASGQVIGPVPAAARPDWLPPATVLDQLEASLAEREAAKAATPATNGNTASRPAVAGAGSEPPAPVPSPTSPTAIPAATPTAQPQAAPAATARPLRRAARPPV